MITAEAILAVLPQTQCQRCGFVDCAAYAQAIADKQAPINRCPPGGQEGIRRLAAITGDAGGLLLDPQYGVEQERTLAYVDEQWCIGCTLCIKACPVDAIVGSNKVMHTVHEDICTGCERCVPVCPVDCIELEIVTPGQTAWQAWSSAQAQLAAGYYAAHQIRVQKRDQEQVVRRVQALEDKLENLTAHSKIEDESVREKKKLAVAQALERARAQKRASNI